MSDAPLEHRHTVWLSVEQLAGLEDLVADGRSPNVSAAIRTAIDGKLERVHAETADPYPVPDHLHEARQ
ncbi:hypothetical protein [Halosegnis marinus]|uniref:Ribbon-helix-helix protein, CopG family n=1 Tax=Halosegnis marinus TaxID=3034023 RepID=A0ABD5ZT99_9EURY|nr:hypothetical protein [Halosegnis sp. DT85]